MLSTLVHIKDKNELENHCAFCFFISIKSGVWLVTILTLSVTEGFEMGSCAPASPDPPPTVVCHWFCSVLLARTLSESPIQKEMDPMRFPCAQ